MKHLKEAKQYLEQGNTQAAMEVLENILDFSPKNAEALRLKALIFDSWGRFDDSFALLQSLSKSPSNEEVAQDLERRLEEDRDSLIYSKLTSQGRFYFSWSPVQVVVSLFGLIGCAFFLISSPSLISKTGGTLHLVILFVFLVIAPWVTLLVLNFQGIKKILVGLGGIHVFNGFKKISYTWEELGSVVIEYDPNLQAHYLRLIVYSRFTRLPLLNFDISKEKSVVKARRHFVRLILSYIDVVSYVPRGKATNFPLE